MLIAIAVSFVVGAGLSGFLCYKYGRSVESKAQAVIKAVKQ